MNKNTISKWFSMFLLMMVAGITGATAQSLTVADFSIEQGQSKEVAINVAAAAEQTIYGIQTDITLSEGLTLESVVAADANLQFDKNTLTGGATRVALLSLAGSSIPEGAAIKLTVKASDTFTGGTIKLENSKLTTATNGTEVSVDNSTATVTRIVPVPAAVIIKPTVIVSEKFTSVADLAGKTFAIINETDGKALYGSNAQNLAYDVYGNAFSSSNSGYLWKLVSLENDADAEVHNYYRFQLVTPTGADYNCWGMGGWLNSQPATGACSFILGLEKGNGQDIKNGAVYDVQYVEGQGFTIKNIGTGLYQGANNGPAKNEAPTYFSFATVSSSYIPSVEALLAEGAVWKEIVTDETALTAYNTAVAGIDPSTIEGNGLTEAKAIDAAITALVKAQPAVADADFTRTIINPSFEYGNIDGWTSKDGGGAANNGNFGAATGSFFVERWTAAPNKLSNGSFLQTIAGIPAGKYKLTAEMQNREQGNEDAAGTGLFLVINNGKAEAVTNNGQTIEAVGFGRGSLEIGTKLENCSGNWICFDNFKLTLVEATSAEVIAAEEALSAAIVKAEAKDTIGREGVVELAAAINIAKEALNASLNSVGATVDALNAAKTALEEALAAFNQANFKAILTLKGTVGEDVTLTFGAWESEDTYSVDFGDGNLQSAKVGVNNAGPVKEDGTTGSATKFTGTVAGNGTITVYGINNIWYLVTNGAIPTTFDQPRLMNVVQMSITGVDTASVVLPAYPKMTQFSLNNSSVKSVDVSKVTTLTSLTINSTSASKFEPQLESIDLSKNTELTYISLQGNTQKSGKLTSLDLSNNTKLQGMGLYLQYNQIAELTLPEKWADDVVTETQTITYGLTMINVQNNKLTSLNTANLKKIKSLYAADNQLTSIDVSGMKDLAWFDVKNNKLTGDLDLTANEKLTNVYVNNNELTSVNVTNVTKQFYVDGNKLTLATIPAQPAGMNTSSKAKQFHYAPQADLETAESLCYLDLTSQVVVAKGELDPADYATYLTDSTTFSIVTASGNALVEGTDYEVLEPGKFKFLTAQTEKVHVEMLNNALPKFTAAAPFKTAEFTAVKEATEEELAELTAEIAIAKTLNVNVEAYENAIFTAAEVPAAVEALKVAEYNQVNKDYTLNAAVLVPDFSQWTGDMVPNKGQHWDGTGTSVYYEQTGAQWGQSSWTNNKTTTVKLPKGKYVLYAAGRASAGTACTAYIKVNDVTRTYTSKGDVGFGVATDGTASFDPNASYANGGKGRGFEYRYVAFEVTADEGQDIALEVGGEATAEHQWMSFTAPVLVTTEDNSGIMIPVLTSKITAATADLETLKGTVGEGIFQKPQAAYDEYAAAVAAADSLAKTENPTVEAINAAIAEIDAKAAAFANAPVNAPDADKAYTFELRLGGETPLYMALAESGITIAEEATPLKFVAVEGADGQYNLTNEDGTLFVGLAGGDAWTMSTLAEKKAAWTFTAQPDGAYRINNLVTAGRFVGTNASDKEAGKPCYADKKTDNGNIDWLIAEYEEKLEEKTYEGYVAIVTTVQGAAATPVTTAPQTVTITETETDNLFKVGFSGFSATAPAVTFPAFTFDANVDANEDFTTEIYESVEGSTVSTEGGMAVTFNLKAEGTNTIGNAAPVFYLQLNQNPMMIINVVFAATEADAKAALDVATGITSVKANADNKAIFNLNGQKVNKAQKGLYIINGNKVIK